MNDSEIIQQCWRKQFDINDETHIFVFGSNKEGHHGAGAALTALRHFGAVEGQGEGQYGRSYGIVTKILRYGPRSYPLPSIGKQLSELIEWASANPQLTFFVTKVGTGFAGYTDGEIKRLFQARKWPANCEIPW
jgi:hypothetical protein